MTLSLKIDNQSFNQLIAISTTSAVDMFARTFSFTMSPTIFYDNRILVGSPVVISADGEDVLTGFIDNFTDTYTKDKHTIVVKGRSKTGDLVDSTIGADINLGGATTLKTVAETLIDSLTTITGIAPGEIQLPRLIIKVVVDKSVSDITANEAIKEEIGITYFNVLEKLAKKRAVLLTDNGKGDLVWTRGRGKTPGLTRFVLQNIINGRNNNVKSAVRFQKESERFNLYQANSQPIRFGLTRIETVTATGLVIGEGTATDIGIRSSRKHVFVTENPSDGIEATQRAFWEANIRRARGFRYTAVTNGHSFISEKLGVNKVWTPNFPITVKDDSARIRPSLNMLINTVTLSQGTDGGEETEVVCVPDFAYIPEEFRSPFADIPVGPA